MTKYTAQDFENAKFAEHPDGRLAVRNEEVDGVPWETRLDYFNDGAMASNGWVPVPSRPTMTETELETIVSDLSTYEGPMKERIRRHLIGLGLTVVPNPEPTNAEQIKDALMKADREGITRSPEAHGYDGLAEWLDLAGFKAPGGGDDH